MKSRRAGKAEGKRRLREAIQEHASWQPGKAAEVMRFSDQLDASGVTVPGVSACLLFYGLHCTARIAEASEATRMAGRATAWQRLINGALS